MSTPQFYGPDNVLRESFLFSTNVSFRFFAGVMDPDTVDMLISVNGDTFSSDPDLITFEGSTFIVPNPAAYPNGLQLFAGQNTIEVYSVLTSGLSTPKAKSQAYLSTEEDLSANVEPPSGISIEREDRSVNIRIRAGADSNRIGYNLYATTVPGGSGVGWFKVNPTLISSGEDVEVTALLASANIDSSIALTQDGTQAADPLLFSVVGAQTNSIGTVIQTDFNENFQLSESVTRLRSALTVSSVDVIQQYAFKHDRQATLSSDPPTIPNPLFNTVSLTDPLHYAVTAVYVINGVEIESEFSSEVSGTPIFLQPQLGTFPEVSRGQVSRDITLALVRAEPELDVKPGSFMNDVFVAPLATESSRIRFILEFVQNAQSFPTLLAIDDPGGTGVSQPVSQSQYKQALKAAFYLKSDREVQSLIDTVFDILAARYGVRRDTGSRAGGEVLIYTSSRPTAALRFFVGQEVSGGGQKFHLTSNASISPTGNGSFSAKTGRWATRAFAEAVSPGEAGNVGAGVIRAIAGAAAGVQVINNERFFGGLSTMTNRQLAAVCERNLAGVDAGTAQGYYKTVLSVPGVQEVKVISAGDPLMLRDLDGDTHLGGKVDVWFRGESIATVTDNFAFSFDIAKNVQFEVVGDPTDLILRAIDDRLTAENPLIEMIDFADYGYELKNASKAYSFDLTGVAVLTYNTIQLDGTHNDPADLSLSDLIRGSYRYRTSNKYVFTRQPVRELVSLVGSASGTLSTANYALAKASSPLDLGRSSEAGDYLQVVSTDPTVSPFSSPITVTNEQHVILTNTEFLLNLGINPFTIRVFSADRLVEYISPYSMTGVPDYTILIGKGETATSIELTDATTIKIGQTLLMDYAYDENFVVTYKVNTLVGLVQSVIDNGDNGKRGRHADADVLAKEAVQCNVDATLTVALFDLKSQNQTDSLIRTALNRYLSSRGLEQSVHSSDFIERVKAVPNVSYVVVPMIKLTRADGSTIVQERVVVDQDSDYFEVSAWGTSVSNTFLLTNSLQHTTTDGGGSSSDYRSVNQDHTKLALLSSIPNYNGVPLKYAFNQAAIIGSAGMAIPGYSDNATITATYNLTSTTAIAAKRKELTANCVLVTLPLGSPNPTPVDYNYTVDYVVNGDVGVRDLDANAVEFFRMGGNLQIAYDEDLRAKR